MIVHSSENIVPVLDRPEPTLIATVSAPLSEAEIANLQVASDIFEVRADLFPFRSYEASREAVLQTIASLSISPLLLTVRTPAEGGGQWRGDEDQRFNYIVDVMHGVDAVDIEINAPIRSRVIEAARHWGKTVIASCHFEAMPAIDELDEKLDEGLVAGADYVKLAVNPGSIQEVRSLTRFTIDNSEYPLITLATGRYGRTSRAILASLGSRATYGHSGQGAVVPGQPNVFDIHSDLLQLNPDYRDLKQPAAE